MNVLSLLNLKIETMEKSTRQKAIKYIHNYLGAIRKGETFYGLILADYVKERLGKRDMYPATILRYMRTLKADGEVNFEVESKRESKYIKL